MTNDIHLRKASELFKVKLSEVTKEQRKYAKIINYTLAYSNPLPIVRKIP